MRSVVGVLRQDGAAAPTAPQPTLTGLEALVLRAKGAGARLRVEGSPRALPPGVELSAYRIVEHLLDAVEDEPGVEVLVRFGDDALELAVTGASARRADAALERARERVQLHRGTLRTTTRGDRAEALVLLPVPGRSEVPVRRREIVLGVALGALGALLGVLAGAHPLGIAAGIVLGASLPVAPRHPAVAWGTASAAVLVTAPGQLLPFGAEALIGAHCFAAARYSDRRGAVLGLVALGGSSLVQGIVADASLVPFLLLAGTAWLPGRAVREREVVAAALAERARELGEEQEAYAALAVRHERARIAAELHDIVAHAISVMVVQAGAGQRVAAADPELAGEAFAAIAGAARQAEDDMGRLVVLLSDDHEAGTGVDTADADLALVEDLVAHAARSGLDVALRLEGGATACRARSRTRPTASCRRA